LAAVDEPTSTQLLSENFMAPELRVAAFTIHSECIVNV